MRKHLSGKVEVGYLRPLEKNLAREGGGWDGIELGKSHEVYVVSVPGEEELTPEGKPKLPVCRVKDRDGHFVGRFVVVEVDKPVILGQKLRVLVTAAQAQVVFATADMNT